MSNSKGTGMVYEPRGYNLVGLELIVYGICVFLAGMGAMAMLAITWAEN